MKRMMIAAVCGLMLSVNTNAQSKPAFPSIFTGINYPLPDDIYINPFTNNVPSVRQDQVYIVGWAFSWLTGQQPTSITAEIEHWGGGRNPLAVKVYFRQYRPDVSRAYNGAVLFGKTWWVSDYSGFVLVPTEPTPLDTRYIWLLSTEENLPPTSNKIAVNITPVPCFNSCN